MAKVGRKALLTPTIEWKVRIPVDLAAQADLINLDPMRGTLKYGARSELVTTLLREYLSSRGVLPLDKLEGKDDDGDSINGDINSPINLPENQNG